MKRQLAVAAALAALGLGPTAEAHVTVHPNVLPSGQFVQVVVRVPSERTDADTTNVAVQFPPGIVFASFAPVTGWTTKIDFRKLSKPVTVFGEEHDQEAGTVTWSGGKIAPGQFVEFPLSISLPNGQPGTKLTFKAVQTYSNGEVVRWIGQPSSDAPAPQIALVASTAAAQDVPAGPTAVSTTAAPNPAAEEDDDDEGWAEENLPLILGIVGTLAGLGALGLVLLPRERS